MRKVRLDRDVHADLKAIHKDIAKHSPVDASRFVGRLVQRINKLPQQSLPGAARDDLFPGIRRVNVGDYAILFRLADEKTIEVIQVIHGRRDIPRHLRKPEDTLQ